MAEDLPETATDRPASHRIRTAAKWTGIAVLTVLLLAAAALFGINTEPGRRFLVREINGLQMASGMQIRIGRIDGSIYGQMTIHDLRLADPKGIFFEAPVAKVDWRPFAYLRNHVDVRSLDVPQAHLARQPQLKPGDPNAPTLPDIDIDIGRLHVGRLLIDPPVTGQRHLVSLDGSARIADRRAQLALNAGTIAGPGLAGGDRLVLRLDAVPDDNRFDVSARLAAPANGFVAAVSGVKQPVLATVAGRGSWSRWQGRAQAQLGSQPFLNLAVTGQNGTFSVNGPVRPALLAPPAFRRVLAPFVQVSLVTTLSERRADTRLNLRSGALALAANGVIDLGRSRFDNLKVATRLLSPGAIAPNLSGRDVQLAMVLNGGFGTPVVAYDLTASALGFNGTVVEGLRATGRARVDTDRIVLPISARARRIAGLNPAVGGLLTNVAVDGSFAISGTHVLSDNLQIRSDRINATAIVVADIAKGMYRAGLQGRINNYLVEGVGLLDIDSRLNVVSEGGGFGIRGRVAARTRRIDNASARDFLGGSAVVSADINMNPSGVISFNRVRLSSPNLRITSGSGTYNLDGRVNVRLSGISKAYGPLDVAVTGTATSPQIRIRAARPGFGLGLADVDAQIRRIGNGYAITATGRSQYGPFVADIVAMTGAGPTRLQIRRLTIAGFTFRGEVVQTAAGPFAGTLAVSGQGLNGTIRLSAAGKIQRADVSARANGATIPGNPPILIQRGIIQATAMLYPGAPAITGDVQVAGLRRGTLLVQTARARINYRGGQGQVQLVAQGSSGVPFRIAANAALTPNLVRANLRGNINAIPFQLARPAEVRKVGGAWLLSPTTIVLPQGNVRVAGRFGNGMVVQSRLDNLDLSILNVFSPRLGIGGRANGSIDFTQAAGASVPRANARITVAGFTRTGIATVSEAVDLGLAATMGPEGATAAAAIRRGGNVIGRAQVRLQPLAGGGSWTERLLASPLSGGIRYNGPAQVLWSLTGIADQQLSGPIGIAADFSGRLDNPQLVGLIRANSLTFEDEHYGTRITNIALQGRFTSSTLEITQLTGRAGRGSLTAHGTVGFAAASGFPIDIRVALDDAQLARGDDLGATVSGNVAITNSRAGGALISGDLRLPEVRYQIVRQGSAEVAQLEGVRRKGEPLTRPDQQTQQASVPSIWKLDLRVRAPNQVFISGMGLESEWSTDLRVRGTSATPEVIGNARVVRGTYSFSGQRFDLTTGEITFTGGQPLNPRINIQASGDVKDVTITISVTGSGTNPQIAFSSSPALPQDEILARLLFGGSVTELSALQLVQLGSSLNSLRGGGGGLNPLGKLRSATGLSRLRILGADQATGRGTALSAGFYLSRNIYVEVITDARGFTATQLEIALSRSLSILSQAGSFGGSNVNVRYRKQY